MMQVYNISHMRSFGSIVPGKLAVIVCVIVSTKCNRSELIFRKDFRNCFCRLRHILDVVRAVTGMNFDVLEEKEEEDVLISELLVREAVAVEVPTTDFVGCCTRKNDGNVSTK